jgi:hypothetical protein
LKTDDLTLGDLKMLKSLFNGDCNESHPYKIGTAYLIRGVTMYYTGRLISVSRQELVLEDAAWVADTGRYNEAVRKGTLGEVEPIVGHCIIGRGSIVDVVEWPNNVPLPRDVL